MSDHSSSEYFILSRPKWTKISKAVLIGVAATVLGILAFVPALTLFGTANAAPTALTIEQITWNIIGLDSNDVNAGPNEFPIGVRVCNTGGAATDPLTSTFTWTTTNALITLVNASPTQNYPILNPGECQNIFYAVSVTRNASAYDTTRDFTISVSDGTNTVQTGQHLYIEHLISQNRNSTRSITGPTQVLVGNTYTWTVDAFTATNGYEELEHFLTFCPDIYRLDTIATSYTAPRPFTDDLFWADGCAWNTSLDHLTVNNNNCTAPAVKYGGDILYEYHVTIVGAGTCTLRDMVYDFSGSSFHYNTDYPDVSLTVTASYQVCFDGNVFKDTIGPDNDTIDDKTVEGVPNFTVTAYLDDGNGTFDPAVDQVAGTTTTSSTPATQGDYQICVPQGSRYFIDVDTTDPQVTDFTLEGDDPIDTGVIPPSGSNTNVSDQNFDFNPPATITGFLYRDFGTGGGNDGNDTFDSGAGELGISGQAVTYYLDDGNGIFEPGGADGTGMTTAATDGTGAYTISNVAPGTYWLLAPSTVGSFPIGTTNPLQVTVTSDTSANNNFGYDDTPAPSNGGISGTLYQDNNTNNTNDDGADMGAGHTVNIYLDDGDGVFEPGTGDVAAAVPTATTNASGVYDTGQNLPPGNYWVQAPSTAGGRNIGTLNPLLVPVGAGTTTLSQDFGYDPPPSGTGGISGTLYDDDNTNNLNDDGGANRGAGHTVSFYLDDGDGVFEPGTDDVAAAVASDVTDASGVYDSGPNLPPGNYWVSAPSTAGGRNIGTTNPLLVAVVAGSTTSNQDFGYDPAGGGGAPGTVSGTVYLDDTPQNDTFDGVGTETTYDGVTISIYNDVGSDGVCTSGTDDLAAELVTQTTTGGGDGSYSVSLPAGQYCVVAPTTVDDGGTIRSSGTTRLLPVTVTSGGSVPNQDFGYDSVPAPAIRIRVFEDIVTNNDTWDPGEPFVPGIRVAVGPNSPPIGTGPGASDIPFTNEQYTDTSGQAIFTNLATGQTLAVLCVTDAVGTWCQGGDATLPPGFTATPANVSADPNLGTTSFLTFDFPIDPTGTTSTISGTVFDDNGSGGTAGNGVLEGTEPGLSGVTVQLCADASCTTVIASTTSAADGTYSFTGVADGSNYWLNVVTASAPSGYSSTSATTIIPAGGNPLGGDSTGNNFGFQATSGGTTADISGTVFREDITVNDAQDPGEPGISGVMVRLWRDGGDNTFDAGGGDDVLVTQVLSDANGDYIFSGVPEGSRYYIDPDTASASIPTGYTFGTGNDPITIASLSGNSTDNDFGFDPPAAISGVVYRDENPTNGSYDLGSEAAIPNITVTLWQDGGNGTFDNGGGDDVSLGTQVTNASGAYAFNNVPPITASDPPYFVDVNEADPDVPANYSIGTSDPVAFTTLSPGTTGSANFGFVPEGAITGTVYRDDGGTTGTALNNVKDGNEAGIPGTTVTLWRDGGNGTFDNGGGDDVAVGAPVSTDSNGNYTFSNLSVGGNRYFVDVDQSDPQIPANYVIGTPDPVEVNPLMVGTTTVNFGFDPPGTVSGTVFREDVATNDTQDPGEAGIPLISVTLTHFGPDGVLGGGDDTVYAGFTDPGGNYSFANIPPGNVRVDVDEADPDLPNGYVIGTTDPVNQTVQGGLTTTVDFGFDPPSGTIQGTVFQDDGVGGGTLGDGVNDGTGEASVPGVTVRLYNDVNGDGLLDPGDTLAATTTTDGSATNNYSFTGLGPGNYLVDLNQFDPDIPANYTNKSPDPAAVSLALNATETRDFGLVPPPVIKGTVYRDENLNNVQDPGEQGMPNVTVTLGGDASATVTTDANGNYLFDSSNGLTAPGNYTVTVDVADTDIPVGYRNNLGTPPATVAHAVAAGDVLTTDWGFDPPGTGTISGTIYEDTNLNNDAYNGGAEPTIANITVRLWQDGGNGTFDNGGGDDITIGTMVSTGAGTYAFSGLATGGNPYFVDVDQTDPDVPAGYTLGTPDGVQVSLPNPNDSATVDFGFDPPATTTFSGVVFDDNGAGATAGDGVQGGTEPGIGGVTVSLYLDDGDGTFDPGDTLVTTTTTASDGSYSFTNLPPGVYIAVETDPAGYVSTSPNAVVQDLNSGPGTANFGDQQPTGNNILGVVFNDLNNDGIASPGEPGISGVTVELKNSLGVTIQTTTTGPGGSYAFTGLPNGNYTVVETDPAGYTSTTNNSLPVLNLGAPGNTTATRNFGDRQTPGNIIGHVFNDNGAGATAGDGVQGGTEPNLANVTIQLFRDVNGNGLFDPGTDTLAASTTTNAGGDFAFNSVDPGNYIVIETDPAGYTSVNANVRAVTVPAGSTPPSIIYADQQNPPATIYGNVFNDTSGDGVQDPGEAGIPGATVSLYLDTNNNDAVDPGEPLVTFATTGPDGSYAFTGLSDGEYVVVETDPPGYTSAAGTNTRDATLTGGGSVNINFPDQTTPGTVRGTVWNDNGSGAGTAGDGTRSGTEPVLANATVTLYRDVNGNGVLDAGEPVVASTLTDLTDPYNYTFNNVAPGNYIVVEGDPSGFVSSTPNQTAIYVAPGGTSTVDFGDLAALPGTISGTVFDDNGTGGGTANDGTRNGTEPGISSVTVTLYEDTNNNNIVDAGEPVVASTTTDASGNYAFLGVPAGNYVIVETDPVGYTSTVNAIDVDLGAGAASTGNDFADVARPGALGGTVWNDVNQNGVIDAGELPLSGVTVELYEDTNNNGVLDPGEPLATVSRLIPDPSDPTGPSICDPTLSQANAQLITTTSGGYSFPCNPPGSYIVVESDPAGFSSTTPNQINIVIAPGNSQIANFGDTALAGTIFGAVFNDNNANGALEIGEVGLGGSNITLTNVGTGATQSILSSPTGSFSFTGLDPTATYQLVQTNLAGYVDTTLSTVTITLNNNSANVNFGDRIPPQGQGGGGGTLPPPDVVYIDPACPTCVTTVSALLPNTGLRPLWVRLAGPIALSVVGLGMLLVGLVLHRRRRQRGEK